MKRKTFVARDDLLNLINEMAKKSGRSQYDFINETFELTILAANKGANLRVAIDEQSFLKAARDRGFVLGLENLWFETAELAYNNSKEKAMKAWRSAGIWFVKIFSLEATDDPIQSLKKELKAYTWNVPDLNLTQVGSEITVQAISPKFSEPYSMLFSAFLEGALDTLGYSIESREVSNGSVRLIALKK
ncbi:MAG: hypothetical protein ABSF36_00280 [Candidatus Methanomethylicaceae archaeon]|jgi:hypothetical protein